MVVRVRMGTTYCGCPDEIQYFEVEDMEEFDSDRFSTEILNAIFNRWFPHYFMDVEPIESKDDLYNNGGEIDEIEECLGYNPFDEEEEDDDD